MDPCVKLAREFKRADKALIKPGGVDEAKQKAARDRAAFLITLPKPESLSGAGDVIHVAARLACGAIPDNTQRSLFAIGARLKKGERSLDDVRALRETITMITFLPVFGERMPAQIGLPGCDTMEDDHKADILSALGNALWSVARPRLV